MIHSLESPSESNWGRSQKSQPNIISAWSLHMKTLLGKFWAWIWNHEQKSNWYENKGYFFALRLKLKLALIYFALVASKAVRMVLLFICFIELMDLIQLPLHYTFCLHYNTSKKKLNIILILTGYSLPLERRLMLAAIFQIRRNFQHKSYEVFYQYQPLRLGLLLIGLGVLCIMRAIM